MLFNAYQQLFLILLNTTLIGFTFYHYGVYLKTNCLKNFFWGSLIFILYVGTLVLNLQVDLFDINALSIAMVALVIILTILASIQFIRKGKVKWLR